MIRLGRNLAGLNVAASRARWFSQMRSLRQQELGGYERDEYEQEIYKKLDTKLGPKFLDVRDISGGCGSMFAISIVSDQFNGVPMVKQHRLINEVLKDDIKNWHGVQLKTKAGNK